MNAPLFVDVTNNLNYNRDQTEREENTQMNGNKPGRDNNLTDKSTTGDDGHVRVKNHTSRTPLDRKLKMHNVKITLVTSG